MKVLFVCSGTKGVLNRFVKEQMDSIEKLGVEVTLFQINKEGFWGYFLNLRALKLIIKKHKPDIIHAHYGLSGLLANLQRKVPVVTTFHGSDINNTYVLSFSKLSHILSAASIFVTEEMKRKVPGKRRSHTIPCGVDLLTFRPIEINKADLSEIIDVECINILFSSFFSNPIKNYRLARNACNEAQKLIGSKINLIELKGYTRAEVNRLLNTVDCLLLTSFSEGSPQIIKEAMACNCPVVTTKVGDISQLISGTDGCYICNYDPGSVSKGIASAIEYSRLAVSSNSRQRIINMKLDMENVARRIIDVYSTVLRTN